MTLKCPGCDKEFEAQREADRYCANCRAAHTMRLGNWLLNSGRRMF